MLPVSFLRSPLALLAVIALISAPAIALAVPKDNEAGIVAAGEVIDRCLSGARALDCKRVGYEACEKAGSESQLELNQCSGYSRAAWERRLTMIEDELTTLSQMPKPPMYSPPGVDLGARLKKSIALWHEWNDADCALQSATSIGGTMHALELGLCLSDHTAERVQELRSIRDWWTH